MIAAKVANALALDWPPGALEVIVAVDGGAEAGADRTAELARAAGADQVLELPRGGKVRAQDAAVRAASGDLLAFGDANASWAPDALQRLAARFADPQVGYACGRVQFVSDGGTNQEGTYWRYELWLRAHGTREVVYRKALEEDVAALDLYSPDLVLGTTPFCSIAKERGIPALYFTNQLASRPFFLSGGMAATLGMIQEALGRGDRYRWMQEFFAE